MEPPEPPAWRARKASAAAADKKRAPSPSKRGRVLLGGATARRAGLSALEDSTGSRAGAKELTLKSLESRIDQVSKLALESHDSIREIQAKLAYVVFILPGDSPVVEEVLRKEEAFKKLVAEA